MPRNTNNKNTLRNKYNKKIARKASGNLSIFPRNPSKSQQKNAIVIEINNALRKFEWQK